MYSVILECNNSITDCFKIKLPKNPFLRFHSHTMDIEARMYFTKSDDKAQVVNYLSTSKSCTGCFNKSFAIKKT